MGILQSNPDILKASCTSVIISCILLICAPLLSFVCCVLFIDSIY